MRHLLPILLLLLLAHSEARGQISLESYRESVMEYSWQLKEAAARRRAAGHEQEGAFSALLPTLSLGGDFSLSMRHRAGIKPWDFSLQPQIIATLYAGGELQSHHREATLKHAEAMANEEFSQFEVYYAAEYTYWNLSAMSEYLRATQRYVEIIRSLREIILHRFEEGYTSKGDLLMIEARLSSAEYELLRAEKNHQEALHNFNTLRGVACDQEVELTSPIPQESPLPKRITLEETLDRRPDFRAARLEVERSREGIRQAGAPYLPRLELGVRGGWRPDSPNRRGKTSVDGALFARLSVPIFHFGARGHALRAAQSTALASEWALSQLHDKILLEERNGWNSLSESYAQIEAISHNLAIASENLELSTYSYQEGLSTILEVLQAQIDWISLYSNAITARFNYAVACADYRRITATAFDTPQEGEIKFGQ